MAAFGTALPQASGVIKAAPGGQGANGMQRFNGFAIVARGGAVSANIRENNASGIILLPIELASGGAFGDNFGTPLFVRGDLYLEVLSGGANLFGSVHMS